MDSLSPNEIASQFVAKYYTDWQNDREAMVKELYRDNSILTFESSEHRGLASIGTQLTTDFLRTAKHQVRTTNAHRLSEQDILILVTGIIQLTEDDAPMNFVQTFQISMDQKGGFILNDFFKVL